MIAVMMSEMKTTALQRFTWQSWLGILFLVLIAALASLSFYLYQVFSWNKDQQLSTRFFQQSFRASIDQYEYLPALLAQDAGLRRALVQPGGNLDYLNQFLDFVAQRSGANAVYVMDITGQVKAASNYRQANSFLHQNYSFRPYFSRAIAQRQRQFYYAVGATTGIPGFFISQPVLGDHNRVLGVVVVKLDLRPWEKNWQEAGQNILIAGDNGVVILSGSEAWRYRSIGRLPDQVVEEINQQQQFKGKTITTLFDKSDSYTGPGGLLLSFWKISGDTYLVNDFPISDTGWTLYYLHKNQHFLISTLWFFSVLMMSFILLFLYLRERRATMRSRQIAQENEKRHRSELEAIIENIHIGVISLDENGRIRFLNHAARDLLKLDRIAESREGVKIQQLIDMGELPEFDTDHFASGVIVKPFYESTLLVDEASATPVMFAVSRVSGQSDYQMLMTLVNISKRKRAEEELVRINESLEELVDKRTKALKDAQQELVRQSKVAALGQMAATIVHELSQPLSAMNSSVAAVQMKASNDDWEGALASLSRLKPLSEKMKNVVKLLKYFSYSDDRELDVLELAPMISQSLSLFQDRLKEKGIELEIDNLQSGVFVRVNPLKLDLVIVNIIQNAVDAIDSQVAGRIVVNLKSNSNEAIVTIEDQGGGISSRVMGRLFDPYFTTKEIGKGLGLGLSISHEIIQEYGGNIVAQNAEDGALFTISLPLQNQAVQLMSHGG